MKKSIVFALSISLAIPLVSFAQPAPASTFCNLEHLKNDKVLAQHLSISADPAGLAVEAKTSDADVDKLLQHYSDEHQCMLSSMSMMDLANGLFKGSSGTFVKGSAGAPNSQKYLLIAGDKSICIKKLGLDLPMKRFIPTVITFCSMQALKSDKTLSQSLTFAKDPIGLAVEPKKVDTHVEPLFKAYAVKHKCSLYVISMNGLMKGLIKGSADTLTTGSTSSSGDSMQSNKFLIVEGDKALCVKKLGLQLPLESFLPD